MEIQELTLSQILVDAGAVPFNGCYFDKATNTSIYLEWNVCFKCNLKYKKPHNICKGCGKPTRKKSKKSKADMYHKPRID